MRQYEGRGYNQKQGVEWRKHPVSQVRAVPGRGTRPSLVASARVQSDTRVGRILRIPVIGTLHQRQLLFPVLVALVVLGVLLQGALKPDRPVEASSEDESSLSLLPPPVPRRPDLEKTPLTYFDDYWAQLRERVEGGVLLVGPDATPAVVVMPGLALSSAAAGESVLAELERQRWTPDATGSDAEEDGSAGQAPSTDVAGERLAGEDAVPLDEEPNLAVRPHGLIAVDRDRGVSLFEVDTERTMALRLVPPAAVPSGSYVGAVSRDDSGRAAITPGHLVAAHAEVQPGGAPSLVLSMPLSGRGVTAVVDLDGALVGVAVDRSGTGDAPLLWSSSVVRRVVNELQQQPRCRPVVVSSLDAEVLDLLGLDGGLLVERVRQDAFSPEPSLRSGDVLLEWDGEPVVTPEEFDGTLDTLEVGALVRYRVLRGRRRVNGGTILPGPDCQPLTDPPLQLTRYGLALRWLDPAETNGDRGWSVAATAAGGVAENAGVELHDVVLAVDGRAVEGTDARNVFERLERRGGSTVLTVQRDDHVRMLALIPGE